MSEINDFLKLITPYTLREKAVALRFAIRQTTKFPRVLPDFLIIGAMRGGTSSLFKYLSLHPLIIPSLRKESWFFSSPKQYRKGEAWYRIHFPSDYRVNFLSRFRGARPLTFEASATYLYSDEAPKRAYLLLKNAKLIALLRNPVDRFYSHYQHNVRRGVEKRPLEEVVETGFQLLDVPKSDISDRQRYTLNHRRSFQYLSMGLYAEQLQTWKKYFDETNLLILRSEDFFLNTADSYQQILRFLNLPAFHPKRFKNYSYLGNANAAVHVPSMSNLLRDRLLSWYRPYNEKLFELLGKDLNWS